MITGFPDDLRPFRLALIKALKLKGLDTEASLVSGGALSISGWDHDNWNGGIDTWSIHIEITLEFFIEHESQINDYEKRILDASNLLFRGDEHSGISAISLVPITTSSSADTAALVPEAFPAVEPWKEGNYRLFISHCSSIKKEAKQLRDELGAYGVSAFVAHEDIKPTKIWLTEIEKALDSMDALVALLTPDFPNSEWCDQEVGIAIGKNKLLIPIRLGIDPYGFMGKYQGLAGHGMSPGDLAKEILLILLYNPATKKKISEAVVARLVQSRSFIETKSNMALLEGFDMISEQQARQIAEGLNVNDQIYNAFGIERRIKALLKKHGHNKLIVEKDALDEIQF